MTARLFLSRKSQSSVRRRRTAAVAAPVAALLAGIAAACAAAPAPQSPQEALRAFYNQYTPALPQRPTGAPDLARDTVITRLAFGSCMEETRPAPILDAVIAQSPQAFLFLGDNVYGDADAGDMTLPELRQAYADMAAHEGFRALNAAAPLHAVWDDHDYGMNDADARFSAKEFAERIFLEFWRASQDDPRRARPGVYHAVSYGPPEQRVRIVFLDTRSFRDPLKPGTQGRHYDADQDPAKTMLGPAQWAWLEDELAKPAALTIVASSVQIIADGHSWEAWSRLPVERERLYRLLDEAASPVVLISGDRHRGGLYRRERGDAPALYELTSSSLNLPVSAWGGVEEPGPHRIGATYLEENFGRIDIAWEPAAATDGGPTPVVTLSLHDETGAQIASQEVGGAP